MNKPKFTPGPWYAHDGWGEQDYVYYKTQNQTASNIICKVFTRPKTNKRGCPDAHLIAAAPELYEALKGAVKEACGTCAMMHVNPDTYDFVENGCPFSEENNTCDYRNCIAILRKARGE